MLHEILLSLSGHPSPLLKSDHTSSQAQSVLSPPERDLLRTAAHLSDLHCKLINYTAQISSSHDSTIYRAVATAIDSTHLAAFRRKILEVEDGILRKDAGLVGAYNIVPLTAVMGEFSPWARRMEWLWILVQFMLEKNGGKGSHLIDKLRTDIQTGYADIEEIALSLVKVAEMAWLKQVSAWVLYGRLPSFGGNDFFVKVVDEQETLRSSRSAIPEASQEYKIDSNLLPSFVSPTTASSILFIGTSLTHVRIKSRTDSSIGGLDQLPAQLEQLSKVTFPINGAMFSRTITAVRLSLSRNTLQKLLPIHKVIEILQLLRQFFLLGRGEFAMALSQEADEKIRNRWRRAENLAHEKRDGLRNVVVREGEVAAVLARTWAALGSMQGQHVEEDEGMELARDLLRLTLTEPKGATSIKLSTANGESKLESVASTPFKNLLFSVPVVMTLSIPSPLDLFLSPQDVLAYSRINSYLLSIRRAHLRLTDLWKITPLRRHHPSPPGPPYGSSRHGSAKTKILRDRWNARSRNLRSTWATSSAAIFFLAETEAYLQIEVVEGLWEGFHRWINGENQTQSRAQTPHTSRPSTSVGGSSVAPRSKLQTLNLASGAVPGSLSSQELPQQQHHHDPQTLQTAHRLYLCTLIQRLLLSASSFTEPLYNLLVQIDHLTALVNRLHLIWTSINLEADEGVVDAFSNLNEEETDVKSRIRSVEQSVKKGVEEAIDALRVLSMNSASPIAAMSRFGNTKVPEGEEGLGAQNDGVDFRAVGDGIRDEGEYVPRRVGGVDRLLMKLDFGGWFDTTMIETDS